MRHVRRPSRASHALPLLLLAAGSAFLAPPHVAQRVHSAANVADEVRRDRLWPAPLALAPSLVAAPAHAEDDVPGALVAYGHYLALLLSVACLVSERLLVKPGLSADEEQKLVQVDAVYGLAAVLFLGTGVLRVTSYGKGWDFYQHEPIFWLKMTLAAVAGASSFFVTTTLVKRYLARKEDSFAPLSEKLTQRLTSVINAQLLAVFSIPLAATLMARGVGYVEWLPWQVGAAPPVLALLGLGYKYVKEALDWSEEEA